MGVTQAAGLSLQWFANNFCSEEKSLAKATNKNFYSVLDEQVKAIPIGANKLLYLPYLMGERTPHLDPNCRGVFFGLSAMHTKAHMARAVMEGVTYSLLDCLNVLREINIIPNKIIATGGGGKSNVWRSMQADTFGLPIQTVISQESPALGAAILASVGAHIYPTVQSACKNMIRQSNIITEANHDNTTEYEKYYLLYRKLYNSLKSQFAELAKL